MARFRIAPEVLTHLLDLPEGTELGVITRVPVGNGRYVYNVEIKGPGWPDQGLIDLHYTQDENGVASLTGFTPCS